MTTRGKVVFTILFLAVVGFGVVALVGQAADAVAAGAGDLGTRDGSNAKAIRGA